MNTRPIEFRVWNGSKMVFGPTDDNPNSSWVLAWAAALNQSPQQFTGLLDKNGKKIFEGDILKFNRRGGIVADHSTYFGVVDFSDCSFGIGTEPLIGWSILSDSFEVIGNICENPDLIK